MNAHLHAHILNAYLSRVTHKDLQRILDADAECWRAQANYGTNEQLRVQENFRVVVFDTINNMLAHDKEIITKIVKEVVQETEV
jgi:hypothetical protein